MTFDPWSRGGMDTVIDWAAALTAHDRWLRTAVLARVRHPHAVDEVMQEVAVAAIEQHSPLVDPAKVAPWLYRLSILTALRHVRSRVRQRRREFQRAEASTTIVSDPLRLVLARERERLVQDALQELPPRDVEILLLKYTERWSSRELAEHLGISEHAIESRLQRARTRLRTALAKRQLDEESE